MVSIKVILLGRFTIFPFLKHIAAIVTDVDTGRHTMVNYPFPSYAEDDPRAGMPDKSMSFYSRAAANVCLDTVSLYSPLNYDDFLNKLGCRFLKPFSWTENNCAHMVNDTLQFFFPDQQPSYYEMCLHFARSVFYSPFLCLYVTLMQYLTDKLHLMTPENIFNKAVYLSSLKGIQSLSAQEIDSLQHIPDITRKSKITSDCYLDSPDEKVFKRLLQPLKLI